MKPVTNAHIEHQPQVSSFPLSCGSEVSVRVFGKGKKNAGLPMVVYFHGGLFNCGKVEDAEAIARAIADVAVVVCVDYPLAPKLHFPATVELAFDAVKWACTNSARLGANNDKIFVAGDQAGGNLAAAVSMMSRDRKLAKLCDGDLKGQLLINPMLDPQQTTKSMQAAEDSPCRKAWADYLPCVSDSMHPYAAPMLSQRLGGLAPALIISAERDPMRDEAEQYASKLIISGVPVQMRRIKDAKGGLANPDNPDFAEVAQIVRQFITDNS
ncbi:MAG: alpha/beta hydrolase [Pseudomonadota bacterium]